MTQPFQEKKLGKIWLRNLVRVVKCRLSLNIKNLGLNPVENHYQLQILSIQGTNPKMQMPSSRNILQIRNHFLERHGENQENEKKSILTAF